MFRVLPFKFVTGGCDVVPAYAVDVKRQYDMFVV